MKLINATIVLVGSCNNDPMNQIYLGNFQIDFTTKKPVLSHRTREGNETCHLEVYKDTYTFKTWLNGHGLDIRKRDGVWTFNTGLHAYDSGASGSLINGGPAMEQLYLSYVIDL